ncbi:MAG TPA: hypothetical protein VFG49_14340 [Dyella sp.]|uniref:hypothetical protein n=1 Tax=Dyella sp. TaxID=1869338 RepID=UPI002D78A2C2|nr:hypothetical protein [Dyella sp.]HET6554703.1 hypothetical protein [Dyella sp.]
MNDVHAQQQPVVSSSVATTAMAQPVSAATHGVPHDAAKTSSAPRSARAPVAMATAVGADSETMHYQPRSRANLDSYRNAVTPPPVDNGR